MNPPAERRAEALLRDIARHRPDEAAPVDAPAAEPGDAERVARISAAVLARLPAQPPAAPTRTARPPSRALAWAAVLVVAVTLGTQFGRTPPAPLPAYALEVTGFDAATRGLADSQPSSHASATLGNRLLVVLRPQRAVTTEVVGELWRVEGPRALRLPTPVVVSAQGALFVDAVVGADLALAPGTHRLWLVARDGRATLASEGLTHAESPFTAPGVHAVAFELDVLPERGATP